MLGDKKKKKTGLFYDYCVKSFGDIDPRPAYFFYGIMHGMHFNPNLDLHKILRSGNRCRNITENLVINLTYLVKLYKLSTLCKRSAVFVN